MKSLVSLYCSAISGAIFDLSAESVSAQEQGTRRGCALETSHTDAKDDQADREASNGTIGMGNHGGYGGDNQNDMANHGEGD